MNKYLLVTFLLLAQFKSFSIEAVTFDCSSSGNNYFGAQLEYLTTTENLNVSQLQSMEFLKVAQDVPNFGVTTSTIWLRGKLHNVSNCEGLFEIENQTLDTVELFLYDFRLKCSRLASKNHNAPLIYLFYYLYYNLDFVFF